MLNRIEIKDSKNGLGKTGYTVYAYNYSTNASGYSGSPVYTAIDAGYGVYYFNVASTIKATLVIAGNGSTKITVPAYLVGVVLWGDNVLTIKPGNL